MGYDDTDLLLIRLLQDEPRASYAELARRTGLGESTVRRRVDSLIGSGIIQPAMIADIYELGFTTSAFIGLVVDIRDLDRIAVQLRDLPEVTLVAETTGRFDLIIFVAARSLEHLTRFVRAQIAIIDGIQNTETFVTPQVYKMLRDWRLPIDDAGDV